MRNLLKNKYVFLYLSFMVNACFVFSQNTTHQKLNLAIQKNEFNYSNINNNNVIDSILQVISTTKNDTNKIKLYLKICKLCDVKDNLKYSSPVFSITDKLLPLTKDSVYIQRLVNWRYDALKIKVLYYETNNQNSSELENLYKQHINISLKYNEYINYSNTVVNLADYYFRQGNMLKKINTLLSGYEVTKKANHHKALAKLLIQSAFFYANNKDTLMALEYINKAIENEKYINDNSRKNRGYVIRGNLYRDLGQYQISLKSYDDALNGYKGDKDTSAISDVYRQIGYLYQNKKDYQKAIDCFKKGEELAQSNNDFGLLVQFIIGKGDALASLGKYDEAIKEHKWLWDKVYLHLDKTDNQSIIFFGSHLAKDYVLAKQYKNAKYILDTITPLATVAVEISNLENLAFRTDSALGNYKEALIHYHKFIQVQVKLNDAEVAKSSVQQKFIADINLQKAEQEKRNKLANEEKNKQRNILKVVLSIALILIIFAIVIFRSLRKTRKANKTIEQQKQEVENQKLAIEQQKHLVDEKQKEIIESITYAKRLQEAILPPQEFINIHVPNNFILYKPKDLVAGDFYWAEKINNLFFIAAADSTGHGVPGAMVSVVCSNALNRTVKEFKLTETGKILDKTRELVLETFEKSTSEVKDGMDISLLCIDSKSKSIFWSGANNPLWYIQDNELKEIKADKQPIGKTEYPKPFTTHQIEYKENTAFYLFTDGFADQFGGPNGKKFKYKQFSDLLVTNINLTQQKQVETINKAFEDWKGNLEQVDDVCVIGIKI